MEKNLFKVFIEKNEYWYGGAVHCGKQMPFSCKTSGFSFDFSRCNAEDQTATILLSNKGRVIRFAPHMLSIDGGKVYLFSTPIGFLPYFAKES